MSKLAMVRNGMMTFVVEEPVEFVRLSGTTLTVDDGQMTGIRSTPVLLPDDYEAYIGKQITDEEIEQYRVHETQEPTLEEQVQRLEEEVKQLKEGGTS